LEELGIDLGLTGDTVDAELGNQVMSDPRLICSLGRLANKAGWAHIDNLPESWRKIERESAWESNSQT
jgi:hypothetical protein